MQSLRLLRIALLSLSVALALFVLLFTPAPAAEPPIVLGTYLNTSRPAIGGAFNLTVELFVTRPATVTVSLAIPATVALVGGDPQSFTLHAANNHPAIKVIHLRVKDGVKPGAAELVATATGPGLRAVSRESFYMGTFAWPAAKRPSRLYAPLVRR